MGKLKLNVELDGIETKLIFSIHSLDRSDERTVDPVEVLQSLNVAEEIVFSGKAEEKIVVRDFDKNISFLYSADAYEDIWEITIITLCHSAQGFPGTKGNRAIVIQNKTAYGLMTFDEYRTGRYLQG